MNTIFQHTVRSFSAAVLQRSGLAAIAVLVFALLLTSCGPKDIEYDVEFSTLNQGKMLVPYAESDVNVEDINPFAGLEEYNEGNPAEVGPNKATSVPLTSMFLRLFETALWRNIHQVSGTYWSTDLEGNPIQISGKLMYPKDGKIKNLIIVSHYTIGAQEESPSESFNPEGLFATMGYAVAIADYIGYGVTADKVHPYLQSRTTAMNVIDMGLAARALLQKRGLKCASDSIILCGYSQGGATTMYVQYLIENELNILLPIKKNYAGSGPYDIARTYDYSVKKDITGIPAAIPLIIQGMVLGMDNPIEMSYFFKDKLLNNYDDWLNSKKYTIKQINTLIGTNSLKELLTPNAIDKTKPETLRFYRELQNNRIPEYFLPNAPVYMFHSEEDDTVPFLNSQILQKQFRDLGFLTSSPINIEYDFGMYGPHTKGAIKFIFKVAGQLE